MTDVFVVDDHEIVRRGLRDLFRETRDLVLVGEAGTCAEARARVPAVRPDVLMLDVRLPDCDGDELCRDLLAAVPAARVLMFTALADEPSMIGAVLAGASGYLVKDVRGPELVDAVREIASGRSLLDTRATAALMAALRTQAEWQDGPLGELTDRERTVLGLVGRGLTNRQIAERMFLSEKTVKNYVSRVLHKLDVRGRTEAAVLAARMGLIHTRP
ncbi:two-component system response regulator DevR [Nocardia transvalensis]|uniref:Two-component system response regulator DevR n=1 Tax=Nocardia transvalensis TaxID=37333 RepID=A0A7W9PHB3_9NOCA|nr:response regulator transcription factor [Nocardia transvalensis]MBB5915703.1 two-component system response regulator DevR [Nocardia transvalensis]